MGVLTVNEVKIMTIHLRNDLRSAKGYIDKCPEGRYKNHLEQKIIDLEAIIPKLERVVGETRINII